MKYYIYKPTGDIKEIPGATNLGVVDGLNVIGLDNLAESIFDQIENVTKISKEESEVVPWYGEVRGYTKLWTGDGEDPYKKKTNITPDIEANTISLMKKVIIKNIEILFNKRYIKEGNESSSLEINSWEQQKIEAKNILEDNTAETPVLSILAKSKNITPLELAQRVLDKSSSYQNNISNLLATQQLLINDVKSKDSIKALNVWREDYMGIQMPNVQGVEEGRVDPNTNNRIEPVPYGIQF